MHVASGRKLDPYAGQPGPLFQDRVLRKIEPYVPTDLGDYGAQTQYSYPARYLDDNYKAGPSFEFPFENMQFESTERHSEAPTAPSSDDPLDLWPRYSSSIELAPSRSSESEENVPSFPPFSRYLERNPDTPPDSAFGSYTEQSRPGSPYYRDRVMYSPIAHGGHHRLVDSGVGSTEQSRPASPLPSPTSDYHSGSKQSHRTVSPDGQPGFGAVGHSAVCTNCLTHSTPLWRISPEGQLLCNACGLFFKLHGVVRPPSLKMDLIKKRNRGVEEVPAFLRQRPGDSVSERRYSPCKFVETPL